MAIEIGTLTVRASFGTGGGRADDDARLQAALARLRRDLIDEVEERIAEAERRARER